MILMYKGLVVVSQEFNKRYLTISNIEMSTLDFMDLLIQHIYHLCIQGTQKFTLIYRI
jgi:hypothetical protein